MSEAAAAERQTWVLMNDGVRLDVSVCTPSGTPPPGGWPGLLIVHGHGDTGCKVSCLPRARRSAERGYVAVVYSVRGQGASEGLSFHMGAREIFDLQEMVGWVLEHCPVHPEKLAVVGSSQGGWHAYMAAIHCPQVATVVPENIFTDYAEFAVRNGCLNRWFFTRTMRRRIMTAGFQELARQWALSGEWDLLQQWLRPASPLVFVDRIRCPVFILHGWHDVGMPPNEVVALFERLRVPKKLYFGGGGHDGQDQGTVLEYREALVERWLDHWLKSKDTGILEEAPVSCALRPGWDHTQVSDLSAAASGELALYLRAGGRLDAEAPSGPELPANVNNFRTDPSYGLAEALRDDMAGVPAALTREEVVYEGEPLEQDWIILGAPRASLCLLSNRPAFQIHVELYDVDPQGQTPILISRGHWGTRAATPGHHLRVEIETATIHYRLPAGHRLRAVMTNYNTTFAYPTFEVACTRLYHELGRASVVRLPLMGRATCEDVVAKGEAGS